MRATAIVGLALSLAALPDLLADRTFYLRGHGPHPAWLLATICTIAFAALLAATSPTPQSVTARSRWAIALLLFAGGALLIATPLPATVQFGVLLVVLSAACGASGARFAPRLARALAVAAAAWFVALGVSALLAHAEPRLDLGVIAARPLALALRALGADAWAEGRLVHMSNGGAVTEALPSLDKFGGRLPILFALSIAVVGLGSAVRLLTVAALAAATPLYMAFSGAWLVAASTIDARQIPWWREEWALLMLSPLAALFVLVIMRSSPRHAAARSEAPPEKRGRTVALALIGVGAFAAASGWLWVDPGTVKPGRVLFDERYSDWEPTDEPLEETRFGVRTVYNYYNLAEALGRYFDVQRNYENITIDILKGVDVLVLKTPTRAYPPEVLDAIEQYVRAGGGLWLIGDHTNVFGVTTHLNSVGGRFGLRFASDAVLDVEANRQIIEPAPWSHPIVRRMPTFIWMTGHSTRAPWSTPDVLAGARLLCDAPDFSKNTGFGDFLPSLAERVGHVTQAVALHCDRGRVAHWSDSTVFSNFGVFNPGKLEVALGYIDWLRRENSYEWARPALAGVAIALLSAGFALLARARSAGWLGSAGTLWLGCALAFPAAVQMRELWHPELVPHTPLDTVVYFEGDRRPMQQPVLTTFQSPQPYQYLSALVAIQRVGRHPVVLSEEPLSKDPSMIVMARHGGRDLQASDLRQLLAFVSGGGRLVWLDFGDAPEWMQEQVLRESGVAHELYVHAEPEQLASLRQRLLAAGDQAGVDALPKGPVLFARDGEAIGAHYLTLAFTKAAGQTCELPIGGVEGHFAAVSRQYGRGTLILTGSIDLFSDHTVGESSAVPNARQYRILRTMFDWFRP